jgi:hypothetical protein
MHEIFEMQKQKSNKALSFLISLKDSLSFDYKKKSVTDAAQS